MKTSILNGIHERVGARMVEFAGWILPVQYEGVIAEVKAVRTAAGLFDVSHMGRLKIAGCGAHVALQKLLTNDLAKLADSGGLYTLMCNAEGGVLDDLIVYRMGPEEFYLVVNASNLEKDKAWISEHLSADVRLDDCTSATAMIALQGPRGVEILAGSGVPNAADVRSFHHIRARVAGQDVMAFRTGYTGEDGFEIVCPSEGAEAVWTELTRVGEKHRLAPCGLAARDTLRIEAALPLYGHEIDEHTTPVEAGLMPWVKLDKGDFIGRDAVARTIETGPARKLVGVEMEGRNVPRTDDIVQSEVGDGIVTSGTFSPTLGLGIAMAYLPPGVEKGMRTEVRIHGKPRPGMVRELPFYARLR